MQEMSLLEFKPEQILAHAEKISKIYENKSPEQAADYLGALLKNSGYSDASFPEIEKTKTIINSLKSLAEHNGSEPESNQNGFSHLGLDNIYHDLDLQKKIKDYYLPQQLINSILEMGKIPTEMKEDYIGIGFLDIADYTFLSKFLSPQENQAILNGFFSALYFIIQKNGGYLNKIEGDQLMFHFGGPLDPHTRHLEKQECIQYIARKLFYTCIEMQRLVFLFNEANESIFNKDMSEECKIEIKHALEILLGLRYSDILGSSFNAMFQIRTRVGAHIGEVTIGNFGPEGARQWDIVGMPVITGQRMQMTAPIGGLRITKEMYDVLEKNDIVNEYYVNFIAEAQKLAGNYSEIALEELFTPKKVLIKEKKNAEFDTYSVQVNPGLPETIALQAEFLLEKGEKGAEWILSFIKYYRGNRFVISSLENLFKRIHLNLRKDNILKYISLAAYNKVLEENKNNKKTAAIFIEKNYSLYKLLSLLGEYQDKVSKKIDQDLNVNQFSNYEEEILKIENTIYNQHRNEKSNVQKRYHFYNYIYPLVFSSIRVSILEYQNEMQSAVEELTEL